MTTKTFELKARAVSVVHPATGDQTVRFTTDLKTYLDGVSIGEMIKHFGEDAVIKYVNDNK